MWWEPATGPPYTHVHTLTHTLTHSQTDGATLLEQQQGKQTLPTSPTDQRPSPNARVFEGNAPGQREREAAGSVPSVTAAGRIHESFFSGVRTWNVFARAHR